MWAAWYLCFVCELTSRGTPRAVEQHHRQDIVSGLRLFRICIATEHQQLFPGLMGVPARSCRVAMVNLALCSERLATSKNAVDGALCSRSSILDSTCEGPAIISSYPAKLLLSHLLRCFAIPLDARVVLETLHQCHPGLGSSCMRIRNICAIPCTYYSFMFLNTLHTVFMEPGKQ